MTNLVEHNEEERRYEEAAEEHVRTLDSRVLEEPVRVLRRKAALDVAPADTVADVVRRMAEAEVGCAVVVDQERVAGVFTERDALVRVLAPGKDPGATPVRDVMTADPECLTLDDTLGYALHMMAIGGFRRVPVVDDQGRPAGVISQQEGVQYLVGFFPEAIINQPPRSVAQRPPRRQHGG